MLIIGAESTGQAAEIALTIDGRAIENLSVPAGGRVFKRLTLEPGTLANTAPLNKLVAAYAGPDGKPQTVRLTQFAVAPPEALFAVHHAGWNEIDTARSFRGDGGGRRPRLRRSSTRAAEI